MVMRNPLVHLDSNQIQTIGDVHLGRVFKNNVSLDRRGEYEEIQFNAFKELLFKPRPEGVGKLQFIRCQVGDLFDKPIVSNHTMLKVIDLLEDYLNDSPEPLFIISGNHDDSKSVTEPTSWDILAKFFEGRERIHFVKTWTVHTFPDGNQCLFVGWNIHQRMAKAFLEADSLGYRPNMVVCHLDRISYGNEDNVIPYDFLIAKEIKLVVSGHEHKPYDFWEYNMRVIGTGSLLPYSHAEDPEGDFYITFRSYSDLTKHLDNGGDLQNKQVRVYISEDHMDDFLALNLDCLSLQVNKAETLDESEIVTEVAIESYDAKSIWSQAVSETGLAKETAELLWADIELKGIENE